MSRGFGDKLQLSKGSKCGMKGRWGIGNKPQDSRVCTKDPLTHLPSSHLLGLLRLGVLGLHSTVGWPPLCSDVSPKNLGSRLCNEGCVDRV